MGPNINENFQQKRLKLRKINLDWIATQKVDILIYTQTRIGIEMPLQFKPYVKLKLKCYINKRGLRMNPRSLIKLIHFYPQFINWFQAEASTFRYSHQCKHKHCNLRAGRKSSETTRQNTCNV